MIEITELKKHIFDVVGALHEVHKEMGPGLSEVVYQEALEMELHRAGIPFKRETLFHPSYKGALMNTSYRLDFLCKEDIIVECKSVTELNAQHRAQLYNYMRLLNAPAGILVNFAPRYAEIERYFYDKQTLTLHNVYGQPIP